ncbi:hypothetical protein H632_c368p1 [Helicosporidium sp. ATCC 50920]|nr:hypothetical protein H632_c368p1 [Helicosporidium sp. ATCC 50920]|eukprot:KDD76074.1 hypothetical protein H632_c368p1 [Helicosporidium sp. ATCC 50920]
MNASRAFAIAFVALSMLVCAPVQAASLESVADFVEVNSNQFQILNAILMSHDYTAYLAESASNTLFLVPDAAFVRAFSGYLSSGSQTSVADVIQAVHEASPEAVERFFLQHIVGVNYANPEALVEAGSAKDGADTSLLFYHTGAYYAVQSDDGYAAGIVGPIAFPIGKSTVYIVDNVLGNPSIVTGVAMSR